MSHAEHVTAPASLAAPLPDATKNFDDSPFYLAISAASHLVLTLLSYLGYSTFATDSTCEFCTILRVLIWIDIRRSATLDSATGVTDTA